MLGVKVKKKSAEKARQSLRHAGLLNLAVKIARDESFVFLPLIRKPSPRQLSALRKALKEFDLVTASFSKQDLFRGSLKHALQEKFSTREFALLRRSYDLVGDIAIIEIPKQLVKKEKLIAKTLLEMHSEIRLVCKKLGPHKGVYREEPVKVLAVRKGFPKSLDTIYKEHGVRMKLSLGKVFFSPRLGTERKRIADKVKEGEIVGAWFAGVGPFALVIARHAKPKKIIAIELNPVAARQLTENIALNHFQPLIEGLQGDVRKLVPKHFSNYFDRIAMPLPKTGETFLPTAFQGIKKGGVIHFYQFSDRGNPFEKPVALIKAEALKAKRKIKVIGRKVIREFSKDKVQAVIDFKVLN